MSTLKVNTIQNTSGGSSSTPEQMEQGRAKAWVHMSAISGSIIRDSFGISSIADNGTGSYTVNFSTAFANESHAMTVGSTNEDHSKGGFVMQTSRSTTQVALQGATYGSNTAFDVRCHMAFWGDI